MRASLDVTLPSLLLTSKLARVRSKKWAYALAMLVLVFYLPLMYFVGFLPGIPRMVQRAVAHGVDRGGCPPVPSTSSPTLCWGT